MEVDYTLNPGETVLEDTNQVYRYITEHEREVGRFVLTNERIIWIGITVTRGFFKSTETKHTQCFQLKDVAVFENRVNMKIESGFDAPTDLTIPFNGSIEKYSFWGSSKKQVREIANHINRIVTGNNEDLFSAHRAIPGVGFVADTLKGSYDTIKENIVGRKVVEKVSTECPACSATYEGYKGQTAKCPYCGNIQRL